MLNNPHFEFVSSWKEAQVKLDFNPIQPTYTAGKELQSLSIFVMDYKKRRLPIADRSLEAHYDAFVFSQTKKNNLEAKRWAIEMSYGMNGQNLIIAGCEARVYELGSEVPPDDIDGRSPAVVTWYDGDMFYLIASDELASIELVKIAQLVYK